MRQRSETWARLAARGRFTQEVKAKIGNAEYTAISAPIIDRSLMPSAMSVGNCISASMKVTIRTDAEIPAAAAVQIHVRLTDGATYSEWKNFGEFFISKRETDRGLTSLECFDAMMKATQRYVDPTSSTDDRIGWPKSQKACVDEIAKRIGVTVDSRTVIETDEAYQIDYPTNYTMMDVLGFIGACHGGNWIITPDKTLRLIPLTSPPPETFDIVDYYYNKVYTDDGHKLIWKQYQPVEAVNTAGGDTINVPIVTGKITTGKAMTISRVTIARDENLGYTKGDDTGAELRIENNPCACQAICDDLYTALNGTIYAPFNATSACYDPCAELGDWVLIGDQIRSVIYKQTLTLGTSFRADLEAPYKEETDDEYPYLTEIEKLQLQDEHLKKYSEATKTYLETKIKQTNEQITLEITKLKEADEITTEAISQITLAVDGISLSAVSKDNESYLHLSNGENSSDVALTMSVSNGKTESTITLKAGDVSIASEKINFTGFVTFEGLSGGTTTIDGACIKTGTIDAARINLNTSDFASKSYVTSQISALEDGLSLSVSNGSDSSTISLKSDGVTLSSKTITLSGMVTFSDLSTSGYTTINGGNITTGKLNADYLELSNNYGGFACAYGDSGESSTIGAMMYGSNSNYYVIATGSGVRMQALNTSFYCSTGHIVASRSIETSSDRREKNSIAYDMDRYEQFFLALSPCYYKFNTDTSEQFYSGFIAQDVESALADNGLTNADFAGLTTREVEADLDGKKVMQTKYALRYSEFIALNTYMIQKLYARVAALEETVKNLGGST